VNAHSGFASGRKAKGSARRWSMKTRAFRDGLSEGFAAPMLFFVPASYSRSASIDATVDGAWKAVSSALGAAYRGEVKTSRGKRSRKTPNTD
jgi:hypothetical protein